jgi:hypothetical protein
MPNVKSLEDLKRIRDEALRKRDIKTPGARVQIVAWARQALPQAHVTRSRNS